MKQIQYRKLPRGEERISIIGIGTSSIQAAGEKEIEETIQYIIRFILEQIIQQESMAGRPILKQLSGP